MGVEDGSDLVDGDPVGIGGGDGDDIGDGVAAGELDLRRHGVAVRRERVWFDEDLASAAAGAMERRHEHVQVLGERTHQRDLSWLRPDEGAWRSSKRSS